MTDQELREQAEVMLAYANAPDGEKPKMECRMRGCPEDPWEPILDICWHPLFTYRLAQSPIAPGHNPDKLTVDQVGVADGYRLLSANEQTARNKLQTLGIEIWKGDLIGWLSNTSAYPQGWYANPDQTFRTKNPPGYYLPKPKKLVRKPCGPEHFPPGTVVREITDYEPCKEWWAIICMTAHWLRIGFQCDSTPFDSQTFMNLYERSLDNGKTWLPCYVEVEE